jgi:hypothetical protein
MQNYLNLRKRMTEWITEIRTRLEVGKSEVSEIKGELKSMELYDCSFEMADFLALCHSPVALDFGISPARIHE